MNFAHALWLWGLLAVPVLALLEWRTVQRAERAARALVGTRAGVALLAQRQPGARRLGLALRLAALALLVLGAAEPQWGRESVRRQSQGSDLVFVIDVSASMDTRDVPPSRLDEARREALGLLERVEGSRVGLVAFAGDAVRICPLTLDHAATRLSLETLGSGAVSMPGTDLGRALQTALQALPAGRREEQAIVLWTDGEDLEGRGRSAIEALKREGVRVFAVGVGTPAGDIIPLVDDNGNVTDVKKDEQGQPVRSRLDEGLLRDLARATHGGYFAAARMGGELPRLAAAMGSLARSSRGAKLIDRPVARFTWCAFAALLLLLAELGRPRRRLDGARSRASAAPDASAGAAAKPASAKRTGAVRGGAAAALLLALLLPAARASAQSAWTRGDKAAAKQDWRAAESLYAQRAKRGAPNALLTDLATARAKAGKWEEAQQALSKLTADLTAAGRTANYNLGTLLAENHDDEHALAELRRTLERDPNDDDARFNYELVRRRLDQKKQDEQKKPDPKKDEKKQPPQPQPQQQPGAPQQQPPQPQPQQPQQGRNPQSPEPQPQGGGSPGMTKQQAERLLGSLQELERLEKQHAKRARTMQERRGKDW